MQVRWKRAIVITLCCLIELTFSDLHASRSTDIQPNGEPRMSGIVMVLELSPRLSSGERTRIEQAAADWTLSTNGVADIRVENEPTIRKTGWQYDRIFVRPVDNNELLLTYIDVLIGGSAVGLTDLYGYLSVVPTVFIARERIGSGEEYRSIAEHELGHTIGLMHDNNPNALMWPYNNGDSVCISVSDLRQFCSLYECPADMPEENGCKSDLMCR
jgi:hypothetical protein